jgi:hypothetical protein
MEREGIQMALATDPDLTPPGLHAQLAEDPPSTSPTLDP